MSSDEQENYLEDLKTIKDALIRAEERPIYEPWAFYVWGALLIAAGIVQYVARDLRAILIWLPVVAIGGFCEAFSLVRSLALISLTVLSPTIRRFYLSFLGIALALGFTVVLLHRLGDDNIIPLALIAYLAVIYFLLAQLSYPVLYVHGFALLAVSIVLYVFALPPRMLTLSCTLLAGVSFVIGGIGKPRGEVKGTPDDEPRVE